MPFLLASPVAAPTPPAGPGQRPPARSTDPDASPLSSFGEALARSRKSSTEQAAEPTVRPAPAKVARRPADAEDAPAQGGVNPLAALLIPQEGRFAAAVTTMTTASATALPGSVAAAGLTENPALAANAGLSSPGNPGGLADLLTAASGASGGRADTTSTTADTDTRATLASDLAALLPKGADLAQAREVPAGQGMPLAGDARVLTLLADAPNADWLVTAAATAIALPGNVAAAGQTENPALAANAGTSSLGNPGGLPDLLTAALDASGERADATGTTADANTRAALASGLTTLLPKGTDLAQAREVPAGQGMPLAADARAVTLLADAAGAGQSGLSSGQARDGSDSSAAIHVDGLTEAPLGAADPTSFAGIGGLALPAGAASQQPGSALVPNAPASGASVFLLPEVGSSEWSKALGQQVIHLSTADRQMAELQLNPPGLGPLKVTLSMSDQQMQAAFISAHSSVRAAVEAALPQLRALLAESGISLGQTSVGAESQPQTAFTNGQGGFGSPAPRSGYPGRDAGTAAALPAQPAAVQRPIGQGLRIDTYA